MALGSSIFSDAGGAVSDLFAGEAQGFKAQGAEIEKQKYLEAAQFADENEEFTRQSTAIKDIQAQREANQVIGEQKADVAGAGFAESGSALDLLAASASQSALQRGVLAQQGGITEAGYREQASSLRSEAAAAQVAEDAAKSAETGSFITGAIKGASAIASIALL